MAMHSHSQRAARPWFAARLTATLLLLALALLSTGCTRTFYRRQADIDAYRLVREKANHPHWSLDDYTIAVDPRSRMYDPFCTDCPPMPPDDPTAHELMHCVDNKRGWPFWHDNGDTPYTENPAWPEYIEVDPQGVLRLSSEDAVRLALLHSRDYQSQLEELYLSALDVSFEQFRFDYQFFGGYETFFTHTAKDRAGGDARSDFELNTRDWSVQKLFPTGATLAVGFANSLMWQFSGPDDYAGSTLIDFAFIQPLLRNAGRDRVLERLTISERALLANVRAMEQYRQAFYLEVVTGQNATGGPQRRGGVFGGGLQGFTGVGGGGFGGVGGGGGGAGFGGAGAGVPGAGGYLGLLQTQREIRNQEDNVQRLRRNLSRLSTLLEVQPQQLTADYLNQSLQVAQARQALLGAESGLLTSQNGYEQELDNFKVSTLGLPPQICIAPTDDLLDQFELIDQEIIRLPEDFELLLTSHAGVRREIPDRIQGNVEEPAPGEPVVCRLRPYPELEADLAAIRPALADLKQFVDRIVTEHVPQIEQDIERFAQAVPRRKAWMARVIQRIEESSRGPCELLPLSINPLEAVGLGVNEAQLTSRMDRSLDETQRSFEILSANFQRYAESLARRIENLERVTANGTLTPEQRFELLVQGVFNPRYICGQTRVLSLDVAEDINRELIELQLLQAVARAQSVELQDIDIRADQALEVARNYRRDWMNNRAALVDSWRLIQFNADQLQSDMSILFNGDIANVGDNPFNLQADAGRLQVGVQFDAPLTRLAERNTYRQALIEYQQARRNYYAFEDSIGQGLRALIRTVSANQINFELQRLAVIEAARQVMLNTFIDQESQRTLTTRVTAARDAVSALSDLLDAQNAFMGVWVNYEVLRRSLDFNLGTFQLDSEGLWIDPGKIGQDYGQYDPWLWRTGGAEGSGPGGQWPGASGQLPGASDHWPPATGDRPLETLPPPMPLPKASGSREAPGLFELQQPVVLETDREVDASHSPDRAPVRTQENAPREFEAPLPLVAPVLTQ